MNILAQSELEAKLVCAELHRQGYKWATGSSLLELTYWYKNSDNLILYVCEKNHCGIYVTYRNKEDLKKYILEYPYINAKDFLSLGEV